MKKLFICVVLCLLLPGCGTVTEKALPEASPSGDAPSEAVSTAGPQTDDGQSDGISASRPVLDVFLEILKSNEKHGFENGYTFFNELLKDHDWQAAQFTVVDMDDDGTPEAVIETFPHGDRLVFHYYDGEIYAFAFPYRGMMDLKTNGIFTGSNGADDTTINWLLFEGGKCEIISYPYSDGDNRGKEARWFPFDADTFETDFRGAWDDCLSGDRSSPDGFSMAFGFADENGGRLLLKCYDTGDGPSFDADPNQFTLAVGPYGELVPVSYSGWQDGTEQNDYRDAAYNFDNLSGFVFNAVDGRFRPDKTYILTSEGQFTDALITLNSPAPEKDELTMRYQGMGLKTEDYIYTVKGRGVKWSELLSVTAEGGQIGLFLFEREDDDMLFSIVYLDGPDTLFWDKPAEYDEWCTWRIDMGDEPGAFEPLFLARLDGGLVLALTWGAPEGETVVILYEENGSFIEKDEYLYSRYWAPN